MLFWVLIVVATRYFIRVTISRRMADATKEKDIWVHSFRMPPDSNNAIKMEVGIEDCLHIEFEYNKSKCVSCVVSIYFWFPPGVDGEGGTGII